MLNTGNHLLDLAAAIDRGEHCARVLRLENTKQFICKSLANLFYSGKIENNICKTLKPYHETLGLGP